MILALCREFGWTPDQARASGADVIRMGHLLRYAEGVTGDGG